MKVKEYFSGSGNFSRVAREFGHTTTTIDNQEAYNPDICISILDMSDKQDAWLMWFSPPCKTYSVASIGTHWSGGKGAYIPKTKECELGLKLLEKSIRMIVVSRPDKWFIENPRGVMRKVIDKLFKKYGITGVIRHTVTYCQYGHDSMKPTDIWTNCKEWKPKPMCKNGDPCHVRAPRGSKTGTQGKKNAYERGILPTALCKEILRSVT